MSGMAHDHSGEEAHPQLVPPYLFSSSRTQSPPLSPPSPHPSYPRLDLTTVTPLTPPPSTTPISPVLPPTPVSYSVSVPVTQQGQVPGSLSFLPHNHIQGPSDFHVHYQHTNQSPAGLPLLSVHSIASILRHTLQLEEEFEDCLDSPIALQLHFPRTTSFSKPVRFVPRRKLYYAITSSNSDSFSLLPTLPFDRRELISTRSFSDFFSPPSIPVTSTGFCLRSKTPALDSNFHPTFVDVRRHINEPRIASVPRNRSFKISDTHQIPKENNLHTVKMGLIRALTSAKRSVASYRAPSTSTSTSTKSRPQISLPTELISTTNMLSYTAPSVESMRNAVAAASASPSTASSTINSNRPSFAVSEEPSLTDDSSIDSASSPGSPQQYSHPEYFLPNNDQQQQKARPSLVITTDSLPPVTAADVDNVSPTTVLATPILPRRAPSHSKREHVRLARRRSQRPTSLKPSSTEAVSPSEPSSIRSVADTHHPFSQELEQLSEVVEEMMGAGVEGGDAQDDDRAMAMLGLQKWTAEDYASEVGEPLFAL